MDSELSSQRDTASRPIWGAVILIGLGIIFLAQQLGGFEFRNWWALFILIPAVGAVGSAYRIFGSAGRFTYGVWATLYGGLFPLLVALMFLFNLDWGIYWPLFVILPGLGTLVNSLAIGSRGDSVRSAVGRLHRPWVFTIGLSTTLLGTTFLLYNMGRFDPSSVLPGSNWWGYFILLPALGGLATTIWLLAQGRSIVLIAANLGVAAIVGLTGVVAVLGLDWDLMKLVGPFVLILVGVALLMGFARGSQDTAE